MPYPTMQHFVTEMCTHVHISVTKCCILWYGTDAFWDLWDGHMCTFLLQNVALWDMAQMHSGICEMDICAHFCYKMLHSGIWYRCILGFVRWTCAHFCYKMLHCGIWYRCILGFVRWSYSSSGTSYKTALMWMPQNLTNEKSTLAIRHQAIT